jgi:hypothetical protein
MGGASRFVDQVFNGLRAAGCRLLAVESVAVCPAPWMQWMIWMSVLEPPYSDEVDGLPPSNAHQQAHRRWPAYCILWNLSTTLRARPVPFAPTSMRPALRWAEADLPCSCQCQQHSIHYKHLALEISPTGNFAGLHTITQLGGLGNWRSNSPGSVH